MDRSSRGGLRAPSTPVRVIHSSASGSGTVCPLAGWARGVSASRVRLRPPARRQHRRGPRSTTCSGCSPPPAPRPSWPPAARHCAAPTGRRRWCSSAPTPSPAARSRSLPRRPGRGRRGHRRAARPTEWASAVELGAERVAVLPADESWLLERGVRGGALAGRAGLAGRRRRQLRRCRREHGRDGGGAGRRARACCWSTAIPGAAGWTCCSARSAPTGCAGPIWPDCGGGWPGMRCWRRCPRSAGVHVLASSRDAPEPVPEEALVAVVEAARSVGCPVVVDLPRVGPPDAAAVLADADLAVLVVPGRLRAATAARLLVDGPGFAVVGRAAGGRAGARRPAPGRGGRRRRPAGARRAAARPQRRAAGRARGAAERGRAVPARRRGPPDPHGGPRRCRGAAGQARDDAAPCWTGCAPGWRWSRWCRRAREVAALVREETGGLLGDDDVLLRRPRGGRRAGRRGSAGAAAARAGGHRRPGERSRPGVDRPGRRPDAGRRCASPTTTPSAGSRCAWPVAPDGGWTTPRPGWTSACPTAPACTPSCRRCRAAARACRCGCCAAARTRSTTWPPSARCPGESGRLLRALVARPAAFLVTGGTGSGKTTLLSALLGEADPARPDRRCARTPPS